MEKGKCYGAARIQVKFEKGRQRSAEREKDTPERQGRQIEPIQNF